MAVAEPVTLIGPGVERGVLYRVAYNGYMVAGVIYADAYEGVVRFQCNDGSETELRGRVEIVPREGDRSCTYQAH